MNFILEPILTAFIIIGLLVLGFFLLSFKYKALGKYRNKVIEVSLWAWGILSAILFLNKLSKTGSNKSNPENKLREELHENKEEFHDKIENTDSHDDISERGRDLSGRFRRRK